jgi:hypothetical protein
MKIQSIHQSFSDCAQSHTLVPGRPVKCAPLHKSYGSRGTKADQAASNATHDQQDHPAGHRVWRFTQVKSQKSIFPFGQIYGVSVTWDMPIGTLIQDIIILHNSICIKECLMLQTF